MRHFLYSFMLALALGCQRAPTTAAAAATPAAPPTPAPPPAAAPALPPPAPPPAPSATSARPGAACDEEVVDIDPAATCTPELRAEYRVPETATAGCARDADCILVPADCCGCAGGGRQAAVHRCQQQDLAELRVTCCGTTACPAVLSTDPSCRGRATCQEGRCTLGDAAPAEPAGLEVKPVQ